MDLREAGLASDSTRALEIFLRLARKSDDDVRGQGGAIERVADQIATVQESLGAPTPLHAAKHRVRSALQAEVQVWHQFGMVEKMEELVAKALRFDG